MAALKNISESETGLLQSRLRNLPWCHWHNNIFFKKQENWDYHVEGGAKVHRQDPGVGS